MAALGALLAALGSLLAALGPLFVALGHPLAALGLSWAALGPLLAALGPLLVALGSLLVRSLALLGGPWGTKIGLQTLLCAKDAFQKNIENPQENQRFLLFLASLGRSWAALGRS